MEFKRQYTDFNDENDEENNENNNNYNNYDNQEEEEEDYNEDYYDDDCGFSFEEYFQEYNIPDRGCIIKFSLNQDLKYSTIQLSDAASWEIPELKVKQESFAHGGYSGSIFGLLKKVDRDIVMMRPGYSADIQVKINEFLSQIRQIYSSKHQFSSNSKVTTESKFHLKIKDPSGISRIITNNDNNNCDENNDENENEDVIYSTYERDFFENDSLGLINDQTIHFDPNDQLSNPSDIANLVIQSNRIVCLSGAGISVESGIPPFRVSSTTAEKSKSSVSIWGEFDPNLMTVQGFNSNPEIAKEWWKMKHYLLPIIESAEPNSAHLFFSYLNSINKLHHIITQNIDSLHHRSGISNDKILELHGHMRGVICSNNSSSKFNPIPSGDGTCTYVNQEKLDHSVECPKCPLCNSILRTESVLFGQPLVEDDFQQAIQSIMSADLLFIIGSSLIVHPVNQFPLIAQKLGIPMIIINMDETSYDQYATGLIHQPAGEFLQQVLSEIQLKLQLDLKLETNS